MPFITIDTNAETKATQTELSELVELVSAELSKPKDYIAAKINTGKLMSCGANPETVGALIEMKSIGYHGKIGQLAKVLTDFGVQKFGCEAEAVNIHFVDMPATNVAKGGRTFG